MVQTMNQGGHATIQDHKNDHVGLHEGHLPLSSMHLRMFLMACLSSRLRVEAKITAADGGVAESGLGPQELSAKTLHPLVHRP